VNGQLLDVRPCLAPRRDPKTLTPLRPRPEGRLWNARTLDHHRARRPGSRRPVSLRPVRPKAHRPGFAATWRCRTPPQRVACLFAASPSRRTAPRPPCAYWKSAASKHSVPSPLDPSRSRSHSSAQPASRLRRARRLDSNSSDPWRQRVRRRDEPLATRARRRSPIRLSASVLRTFRRRHLGHPVATSPEGVADKAVQRPSPLRAPPAEAGGSLLETRRSHPEGCDRIAPAGRSTGALRHRSDVKTTRRKSPLRGAQPVVVGTASEEDRRSRGPDVAASGFAQRSLHLPSRPAPVTEATFAVRSEEHAPGRPTRPPKRPGQRRTVAHRPRARFCRRSDSSGGDPEGPPAWDVALSSRDLAAEATRSQARSEELASLGSDHSIRRSFTSDASAAERLPSPRATSPPKGLGRRRAPKSPPRSDRTDQSPKRPAERRPTKSTSSGLERGRHRSDHRRHAPKSLPRSSSRDPLDAEAPTVARSEELAVIPAGPDPPPKRLVRGEHRSAHRVPEERDH